MQWFIEWKWLSIHKIYVKLNGLKMRFETGVSILCFQLFDNVNPKVWIHPMHCDVECFDCDGWIPGTMFISNLASNVLWS